MLIYLSLIFTHFILVLLTLKNLYKNKRLISYWTLFILFLPIIGSIAYFYANKK